jgi:hypothetical protein
MCTSGRAAPSTATLRVRHDAAGAARVQNDPSPSVRRNDATMENGSHLPIESRRPVAAALHSLSGFGPTPADHESSGGIARGQIPGVLAGLAATLLASDLASSLLASRRGFGEVCSENFLQPLNLSSTFGPFSERTNTLTRGYDHPHHSAFNRPSVSDIVYPCTRGADHIQQNKLPTSKNGHRSSSTSNVRQRVHSISSSARAREEGEKQCPLTSF